MHIHIRLHMLVYAYACNHESVHVMYTRTYTGRTVHTGYTVHIVQAEHTVKLYTWHTLLSIPYAYIHMYTCVLIHLQVRAHVYM